MVKKWEYRVVDFDIDSVGLWAKWLNTDYGSMGWELVCVVRTNLFIFKRAVPD